MDFEQAKQDILQWVVEFVEKPHADLNGWPPCPFARRARVEGQFDIRAGRVDPYTDLRQAELGSFTVAAYVYDAAQFDPDEFDEFVTAANQAFLLPRNLIALADHPDAPEQINGVIMNQGTWALAFLQPLDKLDEFARVIAQRGYYDGWPEHYLQELFQGRQDPRS